MNKKGFTLIELLAVIVILAIIALIATPIILNMINEARKSAAKSSALGYVDSIEAYTGFRQLSEDAEIDGYDVDIPTMTNGKVTCTKTSSGWNNECSVFFEAVDKKNKGKSPDTATIIIGEDGKVQNGTKMKYNGYEVNYDGNDAYVGDKAPSNSSNNNSNNNTTSFGGTIDKTKQYSSAGVEQLGLKGVVYMDPTDLSATCTSSTAVSTPGTKSGCMKFYIFDDSGSNYKMILDHNTTAKVEYNTTTPYVPYEQASIKTTVDNDTTGWVESPRLITAQEIADITNTTTFDGSGSKGFFFDGTGATKKMKASTTQGASPYKWLFDYTYNCTSSGCDKAISSTYGYWTSSPVSDNSNRTWYVSFIGDTSGGNVDIGTSFGVRPVIIISKSKLQ